MPITGSSTARLEQLEIDLAEVRKRERLLAQKVKSFDPVRCLLDGDLESFRKTEFFNEKEPERCDSLYMLAIRLRHWKEVEWMLGRAEAGTLYLNVDHKNTAGESALHLLASTNRGDFMARTIALGADVHAVLPNGWSPLHMVFLNGTESNLEPLLDAGADPKARTEYGYSPLDMAGGRMLDAYRRWMCSRLVHKDFYQWFAARSKADQVNILTDLVRLAK